MKTNESEENIMTIFALCVFSGGHSDAGAEALRAAGYEVIRLPPQLKATLEVKGDDFVEIRREGNDDEDSRDAMRADVNRILDPFSGEIDGCAFMTIAEMWDAQGRGSSPPLSGQDDLAPSVS